MAILTALLASVLGCAPQPPLTSGAEAFARVLYLHGGPAIDAAGLRRIRDLGFTAVAGGSFEPDAVAAAGLRFYVDQAVGKGVLEMRDQVWRPLRERYLRTRDAADLVRPRCLSQAETLTELEATLRQRLQRDAPDAPWAVSLGDEISVTRHANPLDLCFAAPSLTAFRAFLRERYGSIAELNRTWNTSFGSFERVVPMTADQIRRREDVAVRLPRNLAPWAEHRAFMDAELARIVHDLAALTRALHPGLRVGLTGLQPPSAYGGHDYARLLPLLTFFEAYDIGGARELAASLAPPHAAQVVTVFPGAGDAPRLAEAACYDALAHGMHGVVVWSAGDVLGADGAPTGYGQLLARVFRELAPAAARFAGARVQRSPVWILESQASVRAHWMLDSAADGETWIARLSSYEAQHSTSLAGRHGWLRLLQDLGLQPLFVPAARLPAALRQRPPLLLVLPEQLAMSDDVAAAIASFVEAGGTVLADHGTGFYDERLRLRAVPALDALFGIERPPLRREHLFVRQGVADAAGRLPNGTAAAEAALSAAIAQPVGDRMVHIEHGHGRGRAVYLNLAVCEYGRLRLDPKALPAARELRAHVRRVLGEAGVRPMVDVRGDGLPTCIEQVVLQAADGRQLLAVRVNALDDATLMRQLGERGPRDVTVSFPRAVAVRDLSTGVEHPAAEHVSLTLDPWRALLLEVRPER